MRNLIHLAIGLLTVLLIVGCGSATPAATPTATRTPLPEATPVPPTPTPTETPVPPTPTPEVQAAAVTPYPPDVNPLTGLRVDDADQLDHAPLAVKVSNSPAVRPQAGLNSADLVFEHFAEGRVTRFTALFYGTLPERVGSVRSGRLIDLEIPAMYDALFAFSGGSGGVKERLRASDLFPEQVVSPDFGVGEPYFYRVPREGLAFEHTLFVNMDALRTLAGERDIDQRPDSSTWMAFSEDIPSVEDLRDISYFEINYLQNTCTAEWAYNADSGQWLRSTAGKVHSDYLTGEQLNANNVVIVFANHMDTDIWEEMIGDQSNWKPSIEIQIWGSGPALLFRDGKMIQAYWERPERDHMLTFKDGQGNPLPLKPGRTWMQMVPLDTESVDLAEDQLQFTP